jgi:osmotically-inducible protein OsmY
MEDDMNERDAVEGRQTEASTRQTARETRRSGSEQDDRRSMTRSTGGSDVERDEGRWQERESGGGWTGYVVPYRYYGPGYRGVGYYSVMYQGSGDREPEELQSQADQTGSGYGQGWDESYGGRSSSGMRRGAERSSRWSGGYAGRGPKGYQRSDDRLREEISDRLMADDRIDASEIEVTVKDGEVTLTGAVDDRWAKRRAEDVAEQVMGVRDVMNQIRVQWGPDAMGDTQTMASRGQTSGSGTRQRSETNATRSSEQGAAGTNGRRRTGTTSR